MRRTREAAMRHCPRLLIPVFAIALLAGCMTVHDFIAMSAEERANLVCRNEATTQVLLQQAQNLRENIARSKEAILTGFQTERHCVTFMAPRHEMFCEPPHKSHEPPRCWPHDRLVPEERCSIRHIPVNVAQEEHNIEMWTHLLEQTNKVATERLTPCLQKVQQMPPELAFEYYDNGRAPL